MISVMVLCNLRKYWRRPWGYEFTVWKRTSKLARAISISQNLQVRHGCKHARLTKNLLFTNKPPSPWKYERIAQWRISPKIKPFRHTFFDYLHLYFQFCKRFCMNILNKFIQSFYHSHSSQFQLAARKPSDIIWKQQKRAFEKVLMR